MLGILITVAVIAVVAYCVLKNYYPPIVLLLAGLLMLVCAWLMGVDPVDAKKSTNFVGFDFVSFVCFIVLIVILLTSQLFSG